VLVGGMAIGTLFTLFVIPVHLYAGGPRPLQGRIGCHGSKGGNGPEIDQSADNLIPYGLKTNLPA
jgi:hypothetical protein